MALRLQYSNTRENISKWKAGFLFAAPSANLQNQKEKNNTQETSRVHYKIQASREFPRVIVLSFVSHDQHWGVFQAAFHMFLGRTTSHTTAFIITPATERKCIKPRVLLDMHNKGPMQKQPRFPQQLFKINVNNRNNKDFSQTMHKENPVPK